VVAELADVADVFEAVPTLSAWQQAAAHAHVAAGRRPTAAPDRCAGRRWRGDGDRDGGAVEPPWSGMFRLGGLDRSGWLGTC